MFHEKKSPFLLRFVNKQLWRISADSKKPISREKSCVQTSLDKIPKLGCLLRKLNGVGQRSFNSNFNIQFLTRSLQKSKPNFSAAQTRKKLNKFFFGGILTN